MSGLGLSSRLRIAHVAADSLTFGSVRLFKSYETWIHHVSNSDDIYLNGINGDFNGGDERT